MNQQRPLKILTLDGGGLQALATLSTLKDVCKAIAKQNGVEKTPAPHELFDIIGGVGTGGWIALLLGRYRLDIATCMAVYMEIARAVDIELGASNSQRKNRNFKLDQDRLATVVDETLERFDLDPALLSHDNRRIARSRNVPSRCKYAFAAGVVQRTHKQPGGYQLFRSYSIQHAHQKVTLPGPTPESCQLSQVFAATGAAKFFLRPCKVGDTVFFDETFPHSHPITSMALDEAFGLYGDDVEISVLLNIGPGIPPETDCEELEMLSTSPMTRLTRKFSWRPKGRRLSAIGTILGNAPANPDDASFSQSKLSISSETALKLEGQRRNDIRQRLQRLYGDSGADKYHHLGPDVSVEKSSLNDVHAIRIPKPRSIELRREMEAEVEGVVRQHWVAAAA